MGPFLPDETRLDHVHLRTRNLERALAFYAGSLGLVLVKDNGSQSLLAASTETPALIRLTETPDAAPRLDQTTGLYHLAIRFPARRDLALALNRLLQQNRPIQGAADHGVSEAIYLADPDGNGVELYVDRPRSRWAWRNGQVSMVSDPLDFKALMATVTNNTDSPTRVPPQTDLGHIHLQVAALPEAERFFREYLGLAVTQRSYPGALFLAAGGYHHHIAANTWAGKRLPAPDSVGLISYRLQVPIAEVLYCLRNRAPLAGYETSTIPGEQGEVLRIRDPNGHWLEVEHVAVATPIGSIANYRGANATTLNA